MATTDLPPAEARAAVPHSSRRPHGAPPAARLAGWFARRHSLPAELAIVVVLYCVYDTSRGLVAGGARLAIAHAQSLYAFEGSLRIAIEPQVQHLAGRVPGLLGAFAISYMSLHLVAPGAMLLWLHRRDGTAYARMRIALLAASCLALVGFVAWPAAPPRLAHVGIADTIRREGIDLSSKALTLLYNPYAAFPSLHEAYAVLAGYGLWRYSTNRWLRGLGIAYPIWVALEVVATGNHFVLDVVAGVVTAGVGVSAGKVAVARWGARPACNAAVACRQ